jgi:hypothetical protein
MHPRHFLTSSANFSCELASGMAGHRNSAARSVSASFEKYHAEYSRSLEIHEKSNYT